MVDEHTRMAMFDELIAGVVDVELGHLLEHAWFGFRGLGSCKEVGSGEGSVGTGGRR